MHKIAKLKKYALLSHLSLILLLVIHLISDDTLLFHSDLYSLYIYLGFLTLIFTTTLSLIFAFKLPKKYAQIINKTAIYNIAIFWLLALLVQINKSISSTLTDLAILLLIYSHFIILIKHTTKDLRFIPKELIFFLCLISILQIIHKSLPNVTLFILTFSVLIHLPLKIIPDKVYLPMKQKIENISFIILICASLTPVFTISNHIKATFHKKTQNQHLILIVLDAFPAQLLNSYNEKEEKNDFDRLLDKSIIFNNIYTIAPYTYGFFGTLYNGSPCTKEIKCLPNKNLLQTLKNHDITTKRMSFTTLGTPEGSAIKSSNYSGIRSYFITENNTIIPKLLGIDYHIFLSNIGTNPLYLNPYGQFFYNIFHQATFHKPKKDNKHPNIDFYVEEINHNIKNHNKSLTILHTRWTQFTAKDWSKYEIDPQSLEKFRDKTIDFQYQNKDEKYVQHIKNESRHHIQDLAKDLESLIKKINSQYPNNKPTIIITADHGKMMGHNRYDYIWHPQEGAIHTLLSVFNKGTGHDNRYFGTIDLNTTILNFFNITSTNEGISILENNKKHNHISTITHLSDKNKELFIIISQKNQKYQINIHPQGNGEIKLINVNGFDESSFKKLTKLPPHIDDILQQNIKKLKDPNIHPNFIKKLTKP